MTATKGVLDRLRSFVSGIFSRGRSRQLPEQRRTVDREAAQQVYTTATRIFRSDLEAAVDGMLDPVERQTHTPMWFLDFMTGALRNIYLAVVAAGAGGVRNVTRDEITRMDALLGTQRQYLIRWVAQLERTPFEKWSRGQIVTRAMMYADSAKQLLSWQFSVVNTGMPELPFQPADRTQCYNNCKCSWDIQTVDAEAGNYDAYWRLSPVEHCEVCMARARACNPLKIRNGKYDIDLTGLVR